MAALYPLLAVLIWAINAIVNKLSAGAIDPAAISFYRWLLALIVLTPFILPGVIRNRKNIYPYWWKLLILGLLGMALYQSLAYYAAYTISALTIGIFISLIPLLTVLLSIIILRTPPTLGTLVGGLLSFAGLVWLISGGHPAQLLTIGIGKGELMMLTAATAYALYGVLTKRWAMALPNWQSLYMQAFFGALLLLPDFLMAADVSLNAENIPLVLFAGIPASVIAPYVWIHGVMKLGASKTALFMNLTPVFTAIIAIIFLREPLHSYHIIGGGVSLIGVILAQRLRMPLGKNQPPAGAEINKQNQ
ncbi:DMT family transporter [Pragia fontium]|uniref:Permease of the drug/metabolite transporter (DMT) superfamily n=1 Tax=Pragia fontium DSM 5563 = ATCC 49100 TaxID=1122977 RepID=A0AAJ4W9L5_9GAMM|nr:DMT family transporter [Pragia fontium]SFC58458.1 Permease of the drug/metabolite transporter (DMT) superfamily [Pragia fontium DSM 5563 = ATCC 49100]VEJ56682.1 aromatic amino acid exporter [Pragia fontium]